MEFIRSVQVHVRNLGVSGDSTLKQATATSGEDGTLSSSFSEF